MFLFLTVVFLTVSIIAIFTRGLNMDIYVEAAEAQLKYKNKEIKKSELDSIAVKFLLTLFLYHLPMLIINVAYLIYALKVDPLTYPSLVAVAYLMASFVKSYLNKSEKVDTEIGLELYKSKLKKHKHGFKAMVLRVLWIIYYGYMFYALVFGVA